MAGQTAPDPAAVHPEATAGPEAGLLQRPGTYDDIVATRYYYTQRDGTRSYVEHDGRLWVVEAIGVKKVAELAPQQFLASVATLEPEAIRALVWLVRRHRMGEKDLKLHEIDFDLGSVRAHNVDGQGVNIVLPEEPPPDPAVAVAVAAAVLGVLPDLPAERAEELGGLAALMAAAEADGAGRGEAGAGEPPAAEPDAGDSPTT